MSKIPTGLFNRGSKLALAASKIALSQLSTSLKSWETGKEKLESQIELAQMLVQTLGELKGASMKVGQLLSLDLGDYLPKEVIKVLEPLHQNVRSLPWPDIEAILKSELGDRYYSFSDISQIPLASASIGQVHSATLHGRDVVLKVQYPGIREAIPQDMKMLEMMVSNLIRIRRKDIDLSELMSELKEVLMLEADYEHELKMLELYAKNFTDGRFMVPRAERAYSTKNVLCLQRVDGARLLDWIEGASAEDRQRLAEDFLVLYIKEFFGFGLVQTDPNPGNFMITPDGRLALLDFGAVKAFREQFVLDYKKLMVAAKARDRDRVVEVSVALNFIDAREDEKTKDIFFALIDLVGALFIQDAPFDFEDQSFMKESNRLVWELSQGCKYSPPPKDLIFLHRKLGGIFVMLKRLKVKIILRPYWESMDEIIAGP
jgi:aarF domain-containing kinase